MKTNTTPSVVSTTTSATVVPGGFTLGLDLGDACGRGEKERRLIAAPPMDNCGNAVSNKLNRIHG